MSDIISSRYIIAPMLGRRAEFYDFLHIIRIERMVVLALGKKNGLLSILVMTGETTKEMLDDFSYFGERAKEFVIDNPNKILTKGFSFLKREIT